MVSELCQKLRGLALAVVLIALPSRAASFDAAHTVLDEVLKQQVRNARVDYAALKAQPESLNRYLEQIHAVTNPEFRSWNQPAQIAFLCNAYNAFTLRLVIDHYPIQSIKDIGSLLQSPWDIARVKLFGKTITLNTLEHGLLRKNYREPRIHFALVCAAKGCPPLRAEAYTGTRLESQLADQARVFLAETDKNRIAIAERLVYLSPIFKWYGADFVEHPGSLRAALQPYWAENMRRINWDDFTIRYTEYDWALNGQTAVGQSK